MDGSGWAVTRSMQTSAGAANHGWVGLPTGFEGIDPSIEATPLCASLVAGVVGVAGHSTWNTQRLKRRNLILLFLQSAQGFGGIGQLGLFLLHHLGWGIGDKLLVGKLAGQSVVLLAQALQLFGEPC